MKTRDWLIVVLALIVGYILGMRSPGVVSNKYVNRASVCLEDALAVIYSTDTYDGDVPFDDVCDAITDDIYDALAWLEYEP